MTNYNGVQFVRFVSRLARMVARMFGVAAPPLTCDVTAGTDGTDVYLPFTRCIRRERRGRGVKVTMGNVRAIRASVPPPFPTTSGDETMNPIHNPSGRSGPPRTANTMLAYERKNGQHNVGHRMMMAQPNRSTARRLGLNKNHHVRVWCTCMSNPLGPPGQYNGMYWSGDRPTYTTEHDPRRLWSWDALGYADVRVLGSALALYHRHLNETLNEMENDR